MNNRAFDPIATSQKLARRYHDYLATSYRLADANLQAQYEEELRKAGRLSKGPFLEGTPPYTKDKSIRELVDGGLLCNSMLCLGGGDPKIFDVDRPLYAHQRKALEKAVAGHNLAVVTGTGSGKTECFLLPILNYILKEFEEEGPSDGVRAIIMYPMNALANDQLTRLRSLLEGTDITFGRYTGETPKTKKEAAEQGMSMSTSPNELLTREEMRKTPPNILLTNYSMLEYLLLRPADAPLFGESIGNKWRHIAIDEAHVYGGALGTEIGYLLRRLKARVKSVTGEAVHPQCYLTSATIGSEEEMPLVADFGTSLLGETFNNDPHNLDVITSQQDRPESDLAPEPTWSLGRDGWFALLEALGDSGKDGVALAEAIAPWAPNSLISSVRDAANREESLIELGTVLMEEELTGRLVRLCAERVLDVTAPETYGLLNLEVPSSTEDGDALLTTVVEVLSIAQRSEDVPVLSSRYHTFLASPEGAFINLGTMELSLERALEGVGPQDETVPVYELGVCRHCGNAYITGVEKDVSDQCGTTWLDPRAPGLLNDEEQPTRNLYRILGEDEAVESGTENGAVQWLCPICGSLHSESEDGPHRFEHAPAERIAIEIVKADSDNIVTCTRCDGKRAVMLFRMAPDIAGTLVCYDLLRDLPPFESTQKPKRRLGRKKSERRSGSVICFSDNRQDAAYFAPFMSDRYGRYTAHQIAFKAIKERPGATPERTASYFGDRHGLDATEVLANIADEMSTTSIRNGLEGLGLAVFVPSIISEMLEGEEGRDFLLFDGDGDPRLDDDRLDWLKPDYLKYLLLAFFNHARTTGAVDYASLGAENDRWERFAKEKWLCRSGSADKVSALTGSGTTLTWYGDYLKRFASTRTGLTLSRDEIDCALTVMWDLMEELLSMLVEDGLATEAGEEYELSPNVWTCHVVSPDNPANVCDVCGRMAPSEEGDPCLTYKCPGHMRPPSDEELRSKESYFREIYQENPLPVKIEEHTAQLSPEQRRKIQNEFLEGKVNVLSCTTTFELGVDVGDLRAVFLRNMPPAPANYTQRAGRVGRRAGKPGFTVTYCRMRPHDRSLFQDPSKIIKGHTTVPSCYLDNEAIALRHSNAVVLSEFFRDGFGDLQAMKYQELLDLNEDVPPTMEQLVRYMDTHGEQIEQQLVDVFADSPKVASRIGLGNGEWKSRLLDLNDNGANGRLAEMHQSKRADYIRLLDAWNEADNSSEKVRIEKAKGALEDQDVIGELASSGVIPKYGFPSDLVELKTGRSNGLREKRHAKLRIQRGLRQAIYEFSPGSEVLASGSRFTSRGIMRPKDQELIVRNYGTCKNCGTFFMPIDNQTNRGICPTCREEVVLEKRMLEPRFGFEATENTKNVVGKGRPRHVGFAEIQFCQYWGGETIVDEHVLDGGTIKTRYSQNGLLSAINENHGSGFHECGYCHAASGPSDSIKHWDWCIHNRHETTTINRYNALGTTFHSDVLEMRLPHHCLAEESDDWLSATWALALSAAELLNVRDTEIGATFYPKNNPSAILLYDNVPGGAGHASQLRGRVPELVKMAWERVASCTCGEETCCYGCLASYYNQSFQSRMSRAGAKRVLAPLLGKDPQEDHSLSEPS